VRYKEEDDNKRERHSVAYSQILAEEKTD